MARQKPKSKQPSFAKSPLGKLFSSDAQADEGLQKIRDMIYSFAWSRPRRDEAKLDLVLSENGVNRNVSIRTGWHSGLSREITDALPCCLHLVNKRISADILRFIYSTNDLDILVDLKATDTRKNRDKLDKIVVFLQNVNFQRYTRAARVRIHFPDKYPLQDLPAFNQHTLHNISCVLDGFDQLTCLSIRVVPMQGPEDYELRLAAFPFYPMALNHWSFSMLNSTTYKWDPVNGEQMSRLNLAWDLFQEDGSSTAAVDAAIVAEKPAIHIDQTPQAKGSDDAQKNPEGSQENPEGSQENPEESQENPEGSQKNLEGSQKKKKKKNASAKKKGLKKKAVSAATDPPANKTTSEAPSADLSLRPKPPSLGSSEGVPSISAPVQDTGSSVEPSKTKAPITEMHVGSAGGCARTASLTCDSVGVAPQHTPSLPSTKPESTSAAEDSPGHEVGDEATENNKTVVVSPTHNNNREEDATEALLSMSSPSSSANPKQFPRPETSPDESVTQARPHNASPPSSAPSSVTLGRDQSDDEMEIHSILEASPHSATTLRGAGPESEKPARKKRKNRKKTKKTKKTQVADTPGTSASIAESDDQSGQQNSAETGGNLHAVLLTGESADLILADQGWEGLFYNHRPFPLSEIANLKPLDGSTDLVVYTRTNGNKGILKGGPDIDRLMRQKERLAARETERKAEKVRAMGKRKNKKVKEVMIRRKEPSDDLRRRFEDTKQRAASNQGSDLRKRFNEITAEGLQDAIPEAQEAIGLDETDSSGLSSEDTPSSPEQAHRLPLRPSQLGMSSVSYRRRPMGEQRLIEEVEDSDDDASVVRQYSDEGPPSVSDAESQGTEE